MVVSIPQAKFLIRTPAGDRTAHVAVRDMLNRPRSTEDMKEMARELVNAPEGSFVGEIVVEGEEQYEPF
jgi:hypothetical protein